MPQKGALTVSHPLFERHRKTLDGAVEAIRARTYWSAYPEVPSGYSVAFSGLPQLS